MGKSLGGGLRLSARTNIHPYSAVDSKLGNYLTKYFYVIGNAPELLPKIKKGEISYKDILLINSAIMFAKSCDNWVKSNQFNDEGKR